MAAAVTSVLPVDWPQPGPIDLASQDAPHASAAREQWSLHAHLKPQDGAPASLFASFLRASAARGDSAHAIAWALSDSDTQAYVPESKVDRRVPQIWRKRIKMCQGDRYVGRAMKEVLDRGHIPTPDRFFELEASVPADRLAFDFAGSRLERRVDGSYRLVLSNVRHGASCDLVFAPERTATRYGLDGVVKGDGNELFRYFVPRCRVSGSVTIAGRTQPAGGTGWYDHEFGGAPEGETTAPIASNWAAIQLASGGEVSAYVGFRRDGSVVQQLAILVDPRGARTFFSDMSFEPLRWWRSTRTFCEYPVEWRLRVPGADLDLTLKASFDDQEFITFVSPPAFWAGRCDINGTLRGAKTQGLGHLERVGFEADRSLDGFFSAVGREVRASIVHALPLEPTIEQARDLVASRERAHYLDGLDLHQLARALIKPIREITDRGGKSWRSYAALACCDVVKGDSRLFVQWLALPELLHVGSLIVDDVQDRSTVRRGGPTCHMTYGEPLAINAGTAAYFIAQRLLVLATGAISPERKLRFYDLYFEALRAGHAGQALDLDGPSHLVPEAVESGDSSLLERRVLATYQLKTAAPVSALARMGAVAGGGSDAQVDALGHFFDAVGLAFQITDDVLNVRGFKHELKLRGEDLTNGTITLPFARALSRLPVEDRRWLWRTLQSKPSDPAVIASMVEKLVASGALNACVEQAHQMIESAWRVAEPLLEESFAKVMLRAFTWYSLERE